MVDEKVPRLQIGIDGAFLSSIDGSTLSIFPTPRLRPLLRFLQFSQPTERFYLFRREALEEVSADSNDLIGLRG